MAKPSQHWIEDSTHWYGRVLSGTYAHWCPEWDDLPIDESCMEIISCGCYDEPAFADAQAEQQRELDEHNSEFETLPYVGRLF